jgi:hypothetical protein
MKQVFVISENDRLSKSIERYFKFNRGTTPEAISIPQCQFSSERIVTAFRQIADIIENAGNRESQPQKLRDAMAIIDLCDENLHECKAINPISNLVGWSAVVAMLVLAFPEIHWVFITPYRPIKSILFSKAHLLGASNTLCQILRFHDEGFTSLFDPTNMQNTIRHRIREATDDEGRKVAEYVPIRESIAAAIDEEEPYADFNAYAAYRFGFRTHVVTSCSMMERLFKSREDNSSDQEQARNEESCQLIFEDIYLNFPDKAANVPMSDITQRDFEFDKLSYADYRVFVTVGHKRTVDPKRWVDNKEYLRNRWNLNKILYKPFSGIFDLWKRSGLYQWLGRGRYKGLADGYEWPPRKATPAEASARHSAPGRLLEVAKRLIQRAEQILNTTTSVEDSVYGALLALNAQELLGNRTPTTALEALSIKQQLEVTAECMFYGVRYNLDVKSRFADIEKEVRSIGEWFHPKTRRRSELNAQSAIINGLVLRFRQYNQFDEEQECLNKARNLQRHMWWKVNKGKPWTWPLGAFLMYAEYLLGSIQRLIAAVLLWTLFYSFLFKAVEWSLISWWSSMSCAVISFFGLQPPDGAKGSVLIVSVFAIILGFVHLGIFISHFYSMIARR